MPEAPEMPGVPVVPEVPELPDVPGVPDAPRRGPLPGRVPPGRPETFRRPADAENDWLGWGAARCVGCVVC